MRSLTPTGFALADSTKHRRTLSEVMDLRQLPAMGASPAIIDRLQQLTHLPPYLA